MNQDQRRNIPVIITLVIALLITCLLTWWRFGYEQERTQFTLIAAGDHLGSVLDAETDRLGYLPLLAGELQGEGLALLHRLYPWLHGVARLKDPVGPDTGQLDWAFGPVEPLTTPPDYRKLVAADIAPGQSVLGAAQNALTIDGRKRSMAVLLHRTRDQRILLLLDLNLFMETLLRPFHYSEIALEMHDLDGFQQDPFYRGQLASRQIGGMEPPPSWLEDIDYQTRIAVLDRSWLVRVAPLAGFADVQTSPLPFFFFVAGCIISLLLAWMVRLRQLM